MIKGLIKKDLYNLGSYKSSLIIMIIFCAVAIIGTKAVIYGPIIICTMIGMIALSTFSYDEISKANKYILTLPTNRKELVKEIRKMGEDSKVAIRSIRRDGIDEFKTMQKNSEITEDELKMAEDNIQKITDKSIEEIDKLTDGKEKEIMTV